MNAPGVVTLKAAASGKKSAKKKQWVETFDINMIIYIILNTFRFEDEKDYQYEIWLKGSQKRDTRNALLYFFTGNLEEVRPSPGRKIIKPVTFDNLFPHFRHYDRLGEILPDEFRAE